MAKINVSKDQVLHRQGEPIKTLDLLIKGQLSTRYGDDFSIQAKSGFILGAFNAPGSRYNCETVATEDSVIMTFEYDSEDDISTAIQSTPTIAPAIASACISYLNALFNELESSYENARSWAQDLRDNYEDYRDVCATLMIPPVKYKTVEDLQDPEQPEILFNWQRALFKSYSDFDEPLRKGFYSLDINLCIGTIMIAARTVPEILEGIEAMTVYVDRTRMLTHSFTREYNTQKAKLEEATRQDALGTGSSLPSIRNALDTILAFAHIGPATGEVIKQTIDAFIKAPDKAEKSDTMIRIRREITSAFYTIYEAAFFSSLEAKEIPAEVNMFFLFGFMDENLAGPELTAELYKHYLLWENDPNDKVLPLYQWLLKIYRGEALPSKNEFDQNWDEVVREELRTNSITKQQANEKLSDTRAMVRFEMNNMFQNANKTTFGSVFSFIPAFYKENATAPLGKCLLSPSAVWETINKIRDIDYGCFYHPALATYPEFKINHFEYHTEILPYIILMPNMGSRSIMWQEIEGRVRNTPAHMMVSIFHTGSLDKTLLTLCGKYRWEMCRRIQGIHYGDIHEPSLTSEYINYLQFYKKNADLSDEMKEKVRVALSRNHNNYGDVFAADYALYISHESEGISRLNNVSREIIFKYCTFSKKYREVLAGNPKYHQLMNVVKGHLVNRENTVDFVKAKFAKAGRPLPLEVLHEMEYITL